MKSKNIQIGNNVVSSKVYDFRRAFFLSSFVLLAFSLAAILFKKTDFAIAFFGLFMLVIIFSIFMSSFYYLYKLKRLSIFLISVLSLSYLAIFIIALNIRTRLFGAVTIMYIGWSFVFLTMYVLYIEFKYIKPQIRSK